MATTTQNASLGRTRSARLNPANSSKAIAVAPTEGLAPSKQSTTLATASNVSLFLTNLRLLDLNLLPDWPDINSLTFTNKDVAQGQKKRVQCVEWALFQLFSLWDPDMADNKLQPFFPPFDQVQSQNLRAALLRCLERAKKSGVLGRDAILRKSMLDECKGERLEEILAVFSTNVLKKVVAEGQLNSNGYPVAAQNLAMENRGYSGGRDELDALVLAHKVSIARRLDQKKTARAQYHEFAELLDLKERSIARRRDQLQAGAGPSKIPRLTDNAKLDVRRVVRNNWSGNQRWMEALLYGDAKTPRDGLLTAPFDRVWRRLQSNRLSELEDKTSGLLEQLDSRVRAQQKRLGKWQTFRQEMFGGDDAEARNKGDEDLGRHKGIHLGFGAHEGLHPGCSSPRKVAGVKSLGLDGEYGKLLDDLNTELTKLERGSSAYATGQWRKRAEPLHYSTQDPSVGKAVDEPLSELSELEEELAKSYALPPDRYPDAPLLESEATWGESQRPARAWLPQHLKTMHTFRPNSDIIEITPTEPTKPTSPIRPKSSSPHRSPVREHEKIPPSPTPSPIRSPHRSPKQSTSRSPNKSPPRDSLPLTQSPEPMPPSPIQQQADQILESMNAASPSPMKQPRPRHTLSLAERTRLSLERTLSTEDTNELTTGTAMPLSRRTPSSRSSNKKSKPSPINTIPEDEGLADNKDNKAVTEEDDLVARTRKSMAGFEATQQRIRLERQRSERQESKKKRLSNRSGEIARQSYFSDAVDEETEGAEGNSTMMLEELIAKEAAMGQGVDYDSIFKSRPRIKASPPGTPRSLLSLFLFRPGLSWNLCLNRSWETLFLRTWVFRSCRPLARSTLDPLPQCTVRPMLGRSRSLTSMIDSFLCWWAAAKSSRAGRGALFRSAKMPRSSIRLLLFLFLRVGETPEPEPRRVLVGCAQGISKLLFPVPADDDDDNDDAPGDEVGFWERKEYMLVEERAPPACLEACCCCWFLCRCSSKFFFHATMEGAGAEAAVSDSARKARVVANCRWREGIAGVALLVHLEAARPARSAIATEIAYHVAFWETHKVERRSSSDR
ncbi:hypothetical protein VPNG_03096 [Cytospora leucostoma]|uniref:HAUS augmin-like complex subunit 6 N-terminal domain-containing protein n=1 Tax=Cytospora leucostoma TaxID=1230097 RepID=A0A423XG20_9PEZI|nr:hypothetical protein VPNG_03096 [Cytospora leucostoma]